MEDRRRDLTVATEQEFDVAIIGGGITGACAAWDAASRGLSTILLESTDFGGGTSSQSLKILHGGIRYLQHLDIVRLRASCRERSYFLNSAPHLTRVLPFVVPTSGIGMQSKAAFGAALAILACSTPDRNRGVKDAARRTGIGGSISRADFAQRYPQLVNGRSTGAAYFFDGQILNPPRLILAILQSAAHCGAIVLNYCKAMTLRTERGRVNGLAVRDELTGQALELRARTVVNAAGPAAPLVFDPAPDNAAIGDRPFSRDMAFVVDRVFPGDAAVAIQTRHRDPDAIIARGNRHLFFVPWRQYTLIGVHSRIYDRCPDKFVVTEAEALEFINEINEACPWLDLGFDDIHVIYAGLLPADGTRGAGGEVSFGKRSVVQDHGALGGIDGLVSAMSVRWTMGRATAEMAIDEVERRIRQKVSRCSILSKSVRGGDFHDMQTLIAEMSRDPSLAGLEETTLARIAGSYGTCWTEISALIKNRPELANLVAGTDVFEAEIVHAVRQEAAVRLADVLLRRTDIGTGKEPSGATVDHAARLMAAELGWSEAQTQDEIKSLGSMFPLSHGIFEQ